MTPPITSQEIGDIFEKAAHQMILLLFKEWGYKTETYETRRQKSGSQHGFDIYLKVYDNALLPINIFVECKGSKEIGKIDRYELTVKSSQLKRTSFPAKDVHIYFSPTLSINDANDELPIEDNDLPFCVVDMMKAPAGPNNILDLFLAYEGDNADIVEYRDRICNNLVPLPVCSDNFNAIADRLKMQFVLRMSTFLSRYPRRGIKFLTPSLWNNIKANTQIERLPEFYIRLNSDKRRLLEVVANDYHVPNLKARHYVKQQVKDMQCKNGGLIKILSNGGEGKSTFLLDIGKELCRESPVFLLEDISDATLHFIKKSMGVLGVSAMPIVLLDDAFQMESKLEEYCGEIANWPGGIILILSERYYRYQQMPSRERFEYLFQDEPITVKLRPSSIVAEIFERFFDLLKQHNVLLNTNDYENSKKLFSADERKTIAERIFYVLRTLVLQKRISFPFDWDEWAEVHKGSALQQLFLLVSSFYQFGNSVTIDFCVRSGILKDAGDIDIRNAVDNNINQPIIRNGEFLQLRHEKVAEWYISERAQKDNVSAIYKSWLGTLDTPFSKNLLLWTYRNSDFVKCDYLNGLLPQEKVLVLMQDYIAKHPTELPARTEAAKILRNQKKWIEAERMLQEYIELDPDGLHPRTELSKIYQQQKKWIEAETILLESLKIDPEQLHPRTELSKIYQQQKKWIEAERMLQEYIELDPDGLHPRTELSKIYQQQKKWIEAETILLELLALDKENLQARTELSKIYQQQKKWIEAETILLELLALDKENLQARTELSKIYQQQKKWIEAETILLELLALDKENLQARTELSKIYQQQKKWIEAETILLESLKIDPEQLHPRTELSKIYQQQKKWIEAETILLESLKIDPEQLHPRTELSKIYQQQKKWIEAERMLQEYIELDPDGLHPRTELSKIYQQQKKWIEAETILLELLALDKENLQARTELSKIYQQQKKWIEAETILLELLALDKENLQARTELSKIYQQQKKWIEAETMLLESLKIDPEQLHPRTELSKIYQQQKKWIEAEAILLESLKIDPEQLHPRTELSKIYQQQKKWIEAETILLESLKIDPEQLHPRTELSKIYQQQKKWIEAETILLELLALDKENLQARTELSKIYQQQKKWIEAETILLESLKIDPEQLHPRTELSKIYQQQKKWIEAETILLESLKIDPEQLHPRTELSKIYQQQKKWSKAEAILLELLALDGGNYRALTEMALVFKHWQREVAKSTPLHKDLVRKYESSVVESFRTNPQNIAVIMELADLFKKRRQYRATVLFLTDVQLLEKQDLESLRIMELTYGLMNAGDKGQETRVKGNKVIGKNPYVKFRDRFETQQIALRNDREVVVLTAIGKCHLTQTEKYVISPGGKKIALIPDPNFCWFVKDGQMVFFSIILSEGQEFADNVEPYFESKELLTLNGQTIASLRTDSTLPVTNTTTIVHPLIEISSSTASNDPSVIQ